MKNTGFIIYLATNVMTHCVLRTLHTVGLYLLYLLSIQSLQAQDMQFKHLSTENGLMEGITRCILQDHEGFIWIGTPDGLHRYDGYSFKVYKHDPLDSQSLSQNSIYCLYEDRSGLLWIGTLAGLNVFDRKSETFIAYKNDPNNPHSLSDNGVSSIYEDSSGLLWIGTYGGGLNVFDKKTEKFRSFANKAINPKLPNQYRVMVIYEDRTGSLWIGTAGGGLGLFDRKSETFKMYKNERNNSNSLSNNGITCLEEDESGLLWIGTNGGGLNVFDKKIERFRRFMNDPNDVQSLNDNKVLSIHSDRSGLLWVGTESGGLNLFDHKTEKFKTYKGESDKYQSLKNGEIKFIYEDLSGLIWIGGWGLTMCDTKTGKFKTHSLNGVRSIYEDRSGLLWIGTIDDGLHRFDIKTGKSRQYKYEPGAPNSLGGNYVAAIYEDATGLLWIGTNGLSILDKKTETFKLYKADPNNSESLSGRNVLFFHEDVSRLMWIGTADPRFNGGGLNVFDKNIGKFKSYRCEPDNRFLLNNNINFIYEDSNGSLWLGTGGGLKVFNKKTCEFRSFRSKPNDPQSLSNNNVSCILESGNGLMWIATYGGGINVFDVKNEVFRSFTEKDGLSNNKVYGLLSDNYGNLWLSTNKGLSKFTPPADPMNITNKGVFRNYDITDGLQSNEFNSGAYFKNKNGRMYFGGVNGFNFFHPDSVKDNPYQPPVVISDFQVFNQSVGIAHIDGCNEIYRKNDQYYLSQSIIETETIILSYTESVFSFEFKSLSYWHSEKNQYAYKLEGFDNEWIYCGTRRFATYTNLDPGEYVFRVKGSNHDGVWNEKGTSVRVTILPPPWKTWWAYGLYGIAVLGFLYSARRFELNRERKNAQIKESELRAQAAEATSRAAKAQSKIIQIENERRTKELEEARQLQISLLPKTIPSLPHFHIAVYMKTATEVGGDYYDFHVGDNGVLTMVLGDATGHGLKAGHMVSTVKGLFNAYGRNGQVAKTLSEMSRCIKDMNLPRLSMCMLMAKFEPHISQEKNFSARLRISSAGMPPVLVYRCVEKFAEEFLIKGLPLGALKNTDYLEREIILNQGDWILFMSDGFPELADENGETLGYDRTLEIFAKACASNASGGADELIGQLNLAAADWIHGKGDHTAALGDDITFVAIKIIG